MTLQVDVSHRQGDFTLRAAFEAPGGVTAFFGRSGSGKSTLVGAIAGLVRPQTGRVVLDGTVLLDTERRIVLPPHRRRIGAVFQDARLFPHLTVRQNLLFGRLFAPRAEPGPGLAAVADLLGISALLARRPAGLSGGERQRVAIGRALLAKPRLLLMDEPLASLDDARKDEILPFLERLRDEGRVPIVYVSHAMSEVVRLADTLVWLDGGQVTAAGPAATVLSRPDGAGTETGTMLDGTVLSHDDAFGLTILDTPAGPLRLPRLPDAVGARRRVRILASNVMLALDPLGPVSALNVLPGTVESLAQGAGPSVLVRLRCRDAVLLAEVTQRSAADLGLRPGTVVHALVKSAALARGPAS